MSVDLPRLTATVWFPNDPQPMPVKLLSSVIPGDWQHKRDGRGGYDSITGYGSMVAVQRINNTLYITEVLTGGQFSFDLQTMNHSIVSQRATPTSAGDTTSIAPVVDQPFETFINCRITDTSVGRGQALEFGPFTQYNAGPPGIGSIEVTVSALPNRGQKVYRFVVNPTQEFDHPGSTGILDSWFRVIPEQTITDIDGTATGIGEWDLDISYKRTVYGNTADYSGYPEIWLRIVKRTTWSGSGLDAFVTIRATNIQKARSLGGRELFMQEKRTSPAEIHGYLGFHNSKHLFRDTDDYAVFDNFGRVITTPPGWGNSDSGQTWVGTTGLSVDGVSGVLSATGAAQTITARIEDNLTDYDCYWTCWVDQVAVGAEFQVMGLFRFIDQNNKFSLKINFAPAGVLQMSFIESDGGTHFFMGSDLTLPFAYSAGTKIRVRMKMTGFVVVGKAWLDGTREPEAWMKEEFVSGSNIGGPSAGYGFQLTPGGANTNSRPSNAHFSDVRLFLKTPVLDNTGVQWHTGPYRSGILRLAESLQPAWTYSGNGILWTNGRVKWETIFLGGAGPHRDGLIFGRANVPFPEPGALIPVVPSGTTVTSDSEGVPLAADQALYVAVPPGTGWDDLTRYLFIVDGASAREYQLPEWAVLIASRGPAGNSEFALNATPELKLGNGQVLDRWRPLAFRANWTNFAPGWQPCEFRMEANNVVRLRGIFKSTLAVSTGPQSVIGFFADLPFQFTPSASIILHGPASGTGVGTAQINVYPSGGMETPIQSNGGGALWISLEGLSFIAAI